MTYTRDYFNEVQYTNNTEKQNFESIDSSLYYDQENYDNLENELDIGSATEALKNKYRSSESELFDKEFKYMSAGGEAEVFSAGNRVFKVFCKENLLEKNYDDLKNELEKQQSLLQGINGLAKPLKTDMVEINGKNYPIQISKYMERGSLFDIIHDNGYTENINGLEIAIKLTLIVSSLHQMGFVHNDLKPENIFINNKNNVKIGDFSFISKLDSEERKALGSAGYFAPELLDYEKGEMKKVKPSLATDIYSLGVIFYQLFLFPDHYYKSWDNFNYENFQNYEHLYEKEEKNVARCYLDYCKTFTDTLRKIRKNSFCDLDEIRLYTSKTKMKKMLVDLMLGMLEIDPEKRLNIHQVKDKLAKIYIGVRPDYNRARLPINLKNRELIELSVIDKNMNFEEEEIKKIEKNLLLRIKTIINAEDSSNTLKYYMVKFINKTFPFNSIENSIKKDKELTLKDRLIINGLIRQLNNLRMIKIIYCEKRKIHETDMESAIKIIDSFNEAISAFNTKEQEKNGIRTA